MADRCKNGLLRNKRNSYSLRTTAKSRLAPVHCCDSATHRGVQ